MIEINLTPELLAALGLPEGEVTAEAFLAALTALVESSKTTAEAAAKLTEVTAQLDAANLKLGEYDTAAKQAADAKLDEELGAFDLDEASMGVMKGLAPEQRTALLPKLPKKTVAAPVEKPATVPPPTPVHQPGVETAPADKSAAIDKLIAEIRKAPGSKFTTYDAARNEARRRQPELFS